MKNKITIILIVVLCLTTYNSASLAQTKSVKQPLRENTIFGQPIDTTEHYIISRPQYTLSYSKRLNMATWVSYSLFKTDFGKAPRYSKSFISDTSLPLKYYKVRHADYTNSGYDRGHMVRSEERTSSVEDNISTFILTNVCPQTPDLNRLIWLQFERYCENLCKKQNKKLYIVTGGIYIYNNYINNELAVPDSCWKVVIILDSNQTASDISESTQTIAVMMPNINGLKGKKWNEYITTIDAVENSTGYNFFNLIPEKIQNTIEAKKYIPPLSPKK